jgi:hypothetical protein|tara:strand:+ start:1105 stop:1575 length:471 start_codon:yes stop_codon:yes gene_type:complete
MIISQLIDYLIDIKVSLTAPDKVVFNRLEKNLRSIGLQCDELGNVESTHNNLGKLKIKKGSKKTLKIDYDLFIDSIDAIEDVVRVYTDVEKRHYEEFDGSRTDKAAHIFQRLIDLELFLDAIRYYNADLAEITKIKLTKTVTEGIEENNGSDNTNT